jgi:hypothetical protein
MIVKLFNAQGVVPPLAKLSPLLGLLAFIDIDTPTIFDQDTSLKAVMLSAVVLYFFLVGGYHFPKAFNDVDPQVVDKTETNKKGESQYCVRGGWLMRRFKTYPHYQRALVELVLVLAALFIAYTYWPSNSLAQPVTNVPALKTGSNVPPPTPSNTPSVQGSKPAQESGSWWPSFLSFGAGQSSPTTVKKNYNDEMCQLRHSPMYCTPGSSQQRPNAPAATPQAPQSPAPAEQLPGKKYRTELQTPVEVASAKSAATPSSWGVPNGYSASPPQQQVAVGAGSTPAKDCMPQGYTTAQPIPMRRGDYTSHVLTVCHVRGYQTRITFEPFDGKKRCFGIVHTPVVQLFDRLRAD